MKERVLTEKIINDFRGQLICEEKSQITIEKYVQDVRMFFLYVGEKEISKELVFRTKNG